MDPADTEAPPVASFSINRFGPRVIYIRKKLQISKLCSKTDWNQNYTLWFFACGHHRRTFLVGLIYSEFIMAKWCIVNVVSLTQLRQMINNCFTFSFNPHSN